MLNVMLYNLEHVKLDAIHIFVGTHFFLQFKKKVYQPKGALHVSASSEKKILIMGGTRFIGIFLSRLLVKEGHKVFTILS